MAGPLGLLALAGGALAGGGLAASLYSKEWEKDKWQQPEQIRKPSRRGMTQMQAAQELLRRHNAGALDLPDEQIKQLSQIAAQTGMEFVPEAQPIKKFLFDFADSATFGLIPDEWRPASIGEDLHGESWGDRTAGTIGRIGGGVVSGGLLLKGGKMALGGIKGWAAGGNAAQGAARSNQYANMFGNQQALPQGYFYQGGGGLMGMPRLNPVMGPGGSFIMG